VRHPALDEILDLHFGGAAAAPGEAAAHARGCAACRALLDDLGWVDGALDAIPDAPPVDGLERVLARIETVRPRRERRERGLRTLLPSALALVAGGAAVHQGGIAALLAFLAAGSILTLALAPVLILESQRRS
jgi:hypothetical protein